MIPLEISRTGEPALFRDVNSKTPEKSLTGLIGYTCSYIPVEILAATGFRPYRLLHGTSTLSREAEKFVRFDACPLVRSNIRFLIENQKSFVAVVGSTGCDMSRRMFDVISEMTNIPVYLFNNPRTDKPEIFNDEIDWLVKELEHLSNKTFSDDRIGNEIEKWETVRQQFRVLDQKRSSNPSQISTSDFQSAAINYHKGNINIQIKVNENLADKPRIYLLGSPIPYEANGVIQLIEEKLRIVGDYNCGISRFLNINIEGKDLTSIKKAYDHQPACIFKRPNKIFYEWVGSQIKKLKCIGIVAWTLDYCDSFEFELKRIEKKFTLPLLRIRSDLSFQNLSQLKVRIEAFKEVLCSKT